MNIVKAEFSPVDTKLTNQLEDALNEIQSLKTETVLQIKRIRLRSAQQIQRRKIRISAELERQELLRTREWENRIKDERKKLEQILVTHIQTKCREIIHDILLALLDEVPDVALTHAYKRLDSLLSQLTKAQDISVVASHKTLNSRSFSEICQRSQIPTIIDDSLKIGAFSLTLPHGKIFTSVEEDLKQLLENWGEGLELVKELQLFLEDQNG